MSNPFPRINQNRSGPPDAGGGGFRNYLTVPVIGIVVVLVLVWLAWPFRTIDQGEVGVKLRWGQAVAVLQPGFNIVIPGMEHVVLLSTRTLKRTYEKVNTYSRDIQQADNLISVNYRIDPAAAISIYSRYGETYAASIIDPVVFKRFKEVFGGYDAADIV